MKKVKAIRGAICSQNNEIEIIKNVSDLCNQIFIQNKLAENDLISIFFSITKEITVLNPAAALRKGKSILDVSSTALFCCQEAEIENGMKNTIRVMITAYMDEQSEKKNIYLNGAEKLRPDFAK